MIERMFPNLFGLSSKHSKEKEPSPALLLKCSAVDYSLMDKQYIEDKINMIKKHFKGEDLPNIYLLHGEFTNEELNQINNDPKVKAFVSFTKGEGFGRPLLEQAITGKPVITTNWSGHTDFIRPEYNVLIGGNLENIHPSAANNMLLKEGQWFKIDVDVASKAMKDVYKNYKKYVEQSRKQTQFLKTNFSKENMTDVLKTHLDKIQVAANVPLQLPKLKKIELPKLKKSRSMIPVEDKLTICPCCGSDACYERHFKDDVSELKTWLCMTCGFTTNTQMIEGSNLVQLNENHTAELIKDLKQVHEGLAWFPTVVNVPEMGMVFSRGKINR
jgi:hypothetical protein